MKILSVLLFLLLFVTNVFAQPTYEAEIFSKGIEIVYRMTSSEFNPFSGETEIVKWTTTREEIQQAKDDTQTELNDYTKIMNDRIADYNAQLIAIDNAK